MVVRRIWDYLAPSLSKLALRLKPDGIVPMSQTKDDQGGSLLVSGFFTSVSSEVERNCY